MMHGQKNIKFVRCGQLKIKFVVVNKHSTARVASCWFIIYYRPVMHRNLNIIPALSVVK